MSQTSISYHANAETLTKRISSSINRAIPLGPERSLDRMVARRRLRQSQRAYPAFVVKKIDRILVDSYTLAL